MKRLTLSTFSRILLAGYIAASGYFLALAPLSVMAATARDCGTADACARAATACEATNGNWNDATGVCTYTTPPPCGTPDACQRAYEACEADPDRDWDQTAGVCTTASRASACGSVAACERAEAACSADPTRTWDAATGRCLFPVNPTPCGTPDRCEEAALECTDAGGAWNPFNGTCSESAGYAVTKNDCNGENLTAGAPEGSPEHCGILDLILNITNGLAALVGIAVVLSLIVGGIQYSSAADDSNKINAAKKRIYDALLALVFFVFMYGFLQWVIPGGVF